jgi:adenylylsulfate reductase subunit B
MRGYGDVVPLGASLAPLRGTDAIMWTVKFRSGQMKRFKFAIRTTPWGSIEPFHGVPAPAMEDLPKNVLLGEPKYLMVDRVPVPAPR